MALAGNSTDLAKQPATSTNALWQTAAAAIVLLALVVGMVIVTSNLMATKSSFVPAADRSYDQIENHRATTLATSADRSYDQIENHRAGVAFDGLANDRSFDKIQSEQGAVGVKKIVGHRGGMIDR